MAKRALKTMDDVMAALGGPAAVAILTQTKHSAVCNWQTFGRFPAKTYLVMSRALARKRHKAPTALWGMLESSSEAAE